MQGVPRDPFHILASSELKLCLRYDRQAKGQ